jgi:prevent-host-death family protein
MKNRYSIAEARDHLPRIVHEAEDAGPIELTRRGRPVAVVISMRRYEEVTGGRRPLWEVIDAWRKEHDVQALDIDPDEVWGDVRDRGAGRDFKW